MQFDIEECYPFISKELLQKAINYASTFVRISNEEIKELLQKAINYASTFVRISNEEINVIMHSRKSLRLDSNNIKQRPQF